MYEHASVWNVRKYTSINNVQLDLVFHAVN